MPEQKPKKRVLGLSEKYKAFKAGLEAEGARATLLAKRSQMTSGLPIHVLASDDSPLIRAKGKPFS